MRLRPAAAACLAVFCLAVYPAAAQDGEWDMDSMFEEPPAETQGAAAEVPGDLPQGSLGTEETEKEEDVLSGLVQQTGFSLDASVSLQGGFNPGFSEAPWYWDNYPPATTYSAGVGLNGGLGLDFQMSDVLRIRNHFSYGYPGFTFQVDEFFLDYNLFNLVYFRTGLTGVTWGQSRNYTFTNLPARLPLGSGGGSSIIVKTDIPIGIGGLQLLALYRGNSSAPSPKEIGYGIKYNMAARWLDMDIGTYLHSQMPVRSFMSLKTTIAETELYGDFLYTLQFKEKQNMLKTIEGTHNLTNGDVEHWGAFSVGAIQNFFNDKLSVNLEVFFNKDIESVYQIDEDRDNFQQAKVSSFIEGWNGAVNLLIRPPGSPFKDLRLAMQCLFSFEHHTAWLVPAIYCDPVKHLRLFVSVPMALGVHDGFYYRNNADAQNRPFSVYAGVTVNGGYSFGRRD